MGEDLVRSLGVLTPPLKRSHYIEESHSLTCCKLLHSQPGCCVCKLKFELSIKAVMELTCSDALKTPPTFVFIAPAPVSGQSSGQQKAGQRAIIQADDKV